MMRLAPFVLGMLACGSAVAALFFARQPSRSKPRIAPSWRSNQRPTRRHRLTTCFAPSATVSS
jgi:hypothetical protein